MVQIVRLGFGAQNFDYAEVGILRCSTENFSLRGSTAYLAAATRPWTLQDKHGHFRKAASYVAAAFGTFGVVLLFNAFVLRTPWRKVFRIKAEQIRRQLVKSIQNSIRETIRPRIRQSIRAPVIAFQGHEAILHSGAEHHSTEDAIDRLPPASALTFMMSRSTVIGAAPLMTPLPEYEAESEFPGFALGSCDDAGEETGGLTAVAGASS